MKEELIFIDNREYDIPAILTYNSHFDKVLILLHGTGTDKHEVNNGYDHIAESLIKKNIATLRIDFPGCGDSKANSTLYNFHSAERDVLACVEYLKKLGFNRFYLAGWSQGATMAMYIAGRNNFFLKVVLLAAPLKLNGLFDDKKYQNALKTGYLQIDFTWREPLQYGLKWLDNVINIDVLAIFKQYDKAVLLIHGWKDDVVGVDVAYRINNAMKNSILKVMENVDHVFNVFDDFTVLNDVCVLIGDFINE